MKNNIYDLRYVELEPALAAKLFPFIAARRPFDDSPTWRELKAQGLEKIEEESVMDFVLDQHEYNKEKEV